MKTISTPGKNSFSRSYWLNKGFKHTPVVDSKISSVGMLKTPVNEKIGIPIFFE